ncbi:hypothetical protein [Clostridium tyrobutyricum]|uniref:hypothetical protein n=1 Tax=Clostridium tyrobutyricum TaxID=1519 RepID=UPI001C3931F8|nr:hypothetical protein [Clostridium tyrobutyricum]MBV4417349.1 hypothetical protein [Clostridium tyrobutyricum]
MQTANGLNNEKSMSDIIIEQINEALVNNTQKIGATEDENTTGNSSFTNNSNSDTIKIDQESLTQDKSLNNDEFMKWFCNYNEQLNNYKEQIVLLRKELIEKNIIIKKLKGEGIMDDKDIKFLSDKFDKLDEKFDKINEKFDKLDDKFDSKISELDKKLSPKVENINIGVTEIKGKLSNIEEKVDAIKSSWKFIVGSIIVPIVITLITNYIKNK